ncbi:MAG: hypothetical protein JW841_11990 [Deltaproteobacteria bacterium]|nr:hypothetical protein [Deltaproteobacteria bacterium]
MCFSVRTYNSAAKWRSATNTDNWRNARSKINDQAKLTTISWITAGTLGAITADFYFMVYF